MATMLYICTGFAVLVALCSPSTAVLSAPTKVRYSIEGDSVLVKWKHPHGAGDEQPAHGYYVVVQEILKKTRLDAPDFVHVEKNALSVNIKGLKPKTVYEMKVIAYSDRGHKASEPIIVDTKELELLSARTLTVEGVTAATALLKWDYDAMNNVHDIQFKLSCSGVRQYRDKTDEVAEDSTEFEYTAYSTSTGWEAYYASDLEPNTKYSCRVNSLAGQITEPPSAHLTFSTQYTAPVPPPTPVLKSAETSFTAKLFPTTNRFGPIDHYKVFAVPVFKADTEPVSAPYMFKTSLKHLLSDTVSFEAVLQTSEARPFIVGSYVEGKLPATLKFDGHWMKSSFKSKTHYSIVVVAFTKDGNSSEALCSLSALANPPIYISADMQKEWMVQHKEVGEFTAIVVSTIIGVALIFILVFLVAFVYNFYQGKKREAYFYRIIDGSESSEDEIYSKFPAPKDSSHAKAEEKVPSLKLNQPVKSPIPNQSPEGLGGDNVSYNPAFSPTDEGMDQITVIKVDLQQRPVSSLHTGYDPGMSVQENSAPPTTLLADPLNRSSSTNTLLEDPMDGSSSSSSDF